MTFIKVADSKHLELIKKLYTRAFPKEERKPFEFIVQKQLEGTMEILMIEEENVFAGLAIVAFSNDIVLLDYLAISDEIRGQGTGSKALQALLEIYKDRRFVLEIETTKKPCENIEIRQKRKAFYIKHGLHSLDFDIVLHGVEMELLSNAEYLSYEEYAYIHRNAFGVKDMSKLRLVGEEFLQKK